MSNYSLDLLKEAFIASFACEPQYFISSPGRIELGGNHTDHQQGRVLAAAIDLDIRALVSVREDNKICIVSEGYKEITVSLDALDNYRISGSSAALTAGVIKAFADNGYKTGGFNAYITSDLPSGGGLSSSASYEVLMGTILNVLYNNSEIDPVTIAIFGQYAENEFFGKPSGLMDQIACAVGGINAIDFEDVNNPKIEHVDFDFSKSGYSVYVVSSGADHADLTSEYAAITEELAAVCAYFGKKVLRQIPEKDFHDSIAKLRPITGDRAVMRAMHVYAENERVIKQTAALNCGDIESFIAFAGQSGRSSWTLLQNVTLGSHANEGLALTLAVCEQALKGGGTTRVHGGGFGGAALAVVPEDAESEFVSCVENILGRGVATKLTIRNSGPKVICL